MKQRKELISFVQYKIWINKTQARLRQAAAGEMLSSDNDTLWVMTVYMACVMSSFSTMSTSDIIGQIKHFLSDQTRLILSISLFTTTQLSLAVYSFYVLLNTEKN